MRVKLSIFHLQSFCSSWSSNHLSVKSKYMSSFLPWHIYGVYSPIRFTAETLCSRLYNCVWRRTPLSPSWAKCILIIVTLLWTFAYFAGKNRQHRARGNVHWFQDWYSFPKQLGRWDTPWSFSWTNLRTGVWIYKRFAWMARHSHW